MSTIRQGHEVKQLTKGLQYYRRDDGIFVLVYADVSHKTIDTAFAQAVANDQLAYEAGEHIRTIYNFQGNWIISPYLINRTIATANETPKDLVESMAVVGDQLAVRVLSGIVRRLASNARSSIRLFTKEDKAVQWLYERGDYLGIAPYMGMGAE